MCGPAAARTSAGTPLLRPEGRAILCQTSGRGTIMFQDFLELGGGGGGVDVDKNVEQNISF